MELHTIKITPEDIEQHIKSAIIDSAIGKALESAISKNLQGWQFDQAVTKVVEQEIPKIIREIMLEPDKKAMISHAVREAGIKQVPCGKCGLWRTPQELSNEVMEFEAKDRRGRTVLQRRPVCSKCAPNALDGQSAQGEKSVPGNLSKRNEG